MKALNNEIKAKIIHVINKAIFNEKRKIFKIEDVWLYPSEVHLMLVIETDIDTNATEISKRLGVTKGALSQTLTRLEKKGIILKTKDPYNKNELTLSLTSLGKKAFNYCQSSQASFSRIHERYLSKLNTKEKEVIYHFLQHVEKAMDDFDSS